MKTIKLDNLTAAHTHAALSVYIKGLESKRKKAIALSDKINTLRLNEEIDAINNLMESL